MEPPLGSQAATGRRGAPAQQRGQPGAPSCGIARRFGVHPGENVPHRNDLNRAHSAAAGSTSRLCHGEAPVLKLWEGERIGELVPAVRAGICGPGGCTARHGCEGRPCPHQHEEGGSRGLRPVETAGSLGTGGGERSPSGSLSGPRRNPFSWPGREFCRRSCSRDSEVPQGGSAEHRCMGILSVQRLTRSGGPPTRRGRCGLSGRSQGGQPPPAQQSSGRSRHLGLPPRRARRRRRPQPTEGAASLPIKKPAQSLALLGAARCRTGGGQGAGVHPHLRSLALRKAPS
nr:uncharacterized protein LOC125184801 [Anser cygnoides]